MADSNRERIVIMGAAGRDFHDFLTRYRNDKTVEVVAFTAEQIPGIDDRMFPPDLSGPLYPNGIKIRPEAELPALIADNNVDTVVFAYSDVSHETVMHKASLVLACGADFQLIGVRDTFVKANVPVVSVCAVRTGVGKSGISKRVWKLLDERGIKAVDIRHPMPYRDLSRMAVERYASIEDLDRYGVHHRGARGIRAPHRHRRRGLRRSRLRGDRPRGREGSRRHHLGRRQQRHALRPTRSEIVALDPHRPGDERRYHPGETNFLRADVLVINKVDSADPANVVSPAGAQRRSTRTRRRHDRVGHRTSDPSAIAGKRVLVIEDGPTVTHGGMAYGAGALAAREHGAAELVDPRPYAVGFEKATLEKYPHLTEVLPAMGYSARATGRPRRDHPGDAVRCGCRRHAHRPAAAHRVRTCRRCASPTAWNPWASRPSTT